jgi:hypothetical protein
MKLTFKFMVVALAFGSFLKNPRAATMSDTIQIDALLKSYDVKTVTFDLGGKTITVPRARLISRLDGLIAGKAYATFWIPISELPALESK